MIGACVKHRFHRKCKIVVSLTFICLSTILVRQLTFNETDRVDLHSLSQRESTYLKYVDRYYQLTISDFHSNSTPPSSSSRPLLIYHNYQARFGNLMFMFAAAYAFATKTNRQVALPQSSALTSIFQNLTQHAVMFKNLTEYNTRMNNTKQVEFTLPTAFEPALVGKVLKRRRREIQIGGGFQSWKYFTNCAQDIRKIYTIAYSLRRKAHENLEKIKFQYLCHKDCVDPHSVVFVGVHHRHKRVNDPSHLVDNILAAPPEYFHYAMNLFRKAYQHPVFVVATDDVPFVHDHLLGADDVFLLSNPDRGYAEDFTTLVECNHTIRSHGTFGWWAAYLTGGLSVFYYRFKRNTPDYFRPSEIGLDEFGHVMTAREKAAEMTSSNPWLSHGNISRLHINLNIV